MRFILAMFCLIACAHSASAQYGVSNQRDAYGNLARNSGTSPGAVNQGTPNNGAIRNAPILPATNPAKPAGSK